MKETEYTWTIHDKAELALPESQGLQWRKDGEEIIRNFLLAGESWRTLGTGIEYRQGYLCATKEYTVRVRMAGETGYLTIKWATVGAVQSEYEHEIPLEDARSMLENLCPQPQIEKTRYTIPYGGFLWEVDEFFGCNAGLIVAKIELEVEDHPFDQSGSAKRSPAIPAISMRLMLGTPHITWEKMSEGLPEERPRLAAVTNNS